MLETAALLTREILRLAVAEKIASNANIRDLLSSSSSAALEASWVQLDEHRLLGLACHGLARHDLLQLLPERQASMLRAQYEHTRATATILQLTLLGVAAKFRTLGLQPVACKGVVLQGDYYPDPGTRFMQDLDLWIPGDWRLACESVLLQLGFRPQPRHLPDGGNYMNAAGVTIDLHWRMRLFESVPGGYESLTEAAPSGGFRVFEPHALLTHLCAHMLGHYANTGPMLCWLLDLGFVLRKAGHRIDLARLEGMMPSASHWLTLLRSVGFLRKELGFELPADLEAAAREVEPLSLASALRLRRLALWGLPSFAGWGRLLASAARMRDAGGLAWPSLTDLSLWPVDWAEHWWVAYRTPASKIKPFVR
jgi:hypothetical protein